MPNMAVVGGYGRGFIPTGGRFMDESALEKLKVGLFS